jgi:hydrogenase expression/formation protein HypD
MKHVDEYRDGELAFGIARRIAAEARDDRSYRFMEFCGGHTHAISRYGIEDLLPHNIRMIHGPGCPVCVLPIGRIDAAIELATRSEVTLCVYGDLMRVPASNGSNLLMAKAAGADIRMIYSTLDAIRIAEHEPHRQVIFFAIGFETTTPPTAMAVRLAQKRALTNFSIFCNHVITPPAIQKILESGEPGAVEIDGFIGPAHVSTIIGTKPYSRFASDFHKSIVIAGFEPLDVLQAILMLIRQVNEGRAEVENQYIRAVSSEGNRKALAEIEDIFEMRESFEWRGLGEIPFSALRLRERYAEFDAERHFSIVTKQALDNPACECGAILRGVKHPRDCKLFGVGCTPERPLGACMVSSEGSCAAYWAYGRFRSSPKPSGRRAAE